MEGVIILENLNRLYYYQIPSLNIYYKEISWGYPDLFNTLSPVPRNPTEVVP